MVAYMVLVPAIDLPGGDRVPPAVALEDDLSKASI
jgi:hypothetical protein